MIRFGVAAVAVLSLAAVACGGSKRPANDPPAKILLKRDFGERAYGMAAEFAQLSRRHGCTVAYKAEQAISECKDGVIGLGRNGTVVQIACDGFMSTFQCENLLKAILAEGDR